MKVIAGRIGRWRVPIESILDNLTLFAQLENLFDKQYETSASTELPMKCWVRAATTIRASCRRLRHAARGRVQMEHVVNNMLRVPSGI